MKQDIVFFDGHCNLCNKTVDILIKIDQKKLLTYAPISGKTAREVRLKSSLNDDELSVVFFKNKHHIFEKSDAVIEICNKILPLGGFFLLFKLIPRFIRDFVYQLVAKNRYLLFGKKITCRLPSEEEQERFLD